VAAVTYVGHAIRASMAPMLARSIAPNQPQELPEVRTTARRLRAPLDDKH
jgi:hypothetical protein